MSEWKVKSGSKAVLETPVYDKDGAIVTNLDSVSEITFQVKKTEKGTAVIEKTKTAGGIVIDTPQTGYIQITILPADTESEEIRLYKMGVECDFGGTNQYKCWIYMDGIETEDFRISQSIVS